MDKMQLPEIFTGSYVAHRIRFLQVLMWLIELGFRNYFILKRYRFLTTAIFMCSASTVHKSFKIM